MKKQKIIVLAVGVLCLMGGIAIGVGIAMYNHSQPTITIVSEVGEKSVEKDQDTKEIEDPNKEFKYTKEELKEKNQEQVQRNKQELEEIFLINNVQRKEDYLAKPDTYLFENSSTEELDLYQISGFDEELLGLARNEIFARHGYIFSKEDYKKYFENKNWYAPSKKLNEIKLSEVEQYNVKYLKWREKYIKEEGDYSSSWLKSRELERDFCDMYCFEVDKPFKMDLNNDGIDEEIVFQSESKDEWAVELGVIKINGKASEEISGQFQGYIWVVDIDETDNYKELVINDMGPSSDYEDSYYYYDGKQPVFMGKVTGELNSESSAIRNYVEDGILHASIRCDILGTSWYNWDYELTSDHKLQEVPMDYWEVHWQTYAREPITIYENKQLSSKKAKYESGIPMLIVGTDLKEWVKVQLMDGKYGWFNTNEFSPYNLDGIGFAD